jgi:hypothetical protein
VITGNSSTHVCVCVCCRRKDLFFLFFCLTPVWIFHGKFAELSNPVLFQLAPTFLFFFFIFSVS